MKSYALNSHINDKLDPHREGSKKGQIHSWGITNSPTLQRRSRPRDLRLKEIGKFGTEVILAFPRSLFIRMVRPPHFEKFDSLVTGLALSRLENRNWMLAIREVRLEIDILKMHGALGVLETPPKLRNMEHVMEICKG